MKSGIVIRVGAKNIDVVDVDVVTFKNWWDTLTDDAKLGTVRRLINEMACW